MKIYAKQMDPECFDYRVYEDNVDPDIYILGNSESDILRRIGHLYDDYDTYCYEVYYHNSIKELVLDHLPKKENGKRYSPRELHHIEVALKTEKKQLVILTCLSIIKGCAYKQFGLRGCCQGDYVDLYAPLDTSEYEVDWIEAWYFGTGTEIEIVLDAEDDEIKSPDDFMDHETCSFYTPSWKIEDIKKEIQEQYGATGEVVYWQISGTHRITVHDYQIAA